MYQTTTAIHRTGAPLLHVRGDAAGSRRRGRPESLFAPVLVFFLVAGLLIAIAALPTVTAARPLTATRRIRIAPSDTLWSVARANPVPGLTIAQTVAATSALNHLDARAGLQPGAVISIPCAEGYSSSLAMR